MFFPFPGSTLTKLYTISLGIQNNVSIKRQIFLSNLYMLNDCSEICVSFNKYHPFTINQKTFIIRYYVLPRHANKYYFLAMLRIIHNIFLVFTGYW